MLFRSKPVFPFREWEGLSETWGSLISQSNTHGFVNHKEHAAAIVDISNNIKESLNQFGVCLGSKNGPTPVSNLSLLNQLEGGVVREIIARSTALVVDEIATVRPSNMSVGLNLTALYIRM